MKDLNKNFPTVDNALRSTWNNIVQYYNRKGENHDISMIMGFVLLTIDEDTGTPSTQLGPKMGMLPTSLSRPLRHFEDRGLIERHPDPSDGRGVIIKLTPEGFKYREIVKDVVINFNTTVVESVGLEKLEVFFDVCSKIHDITSKK